MGATPFRVSVLLADVSGSARLHEKLGKAEALRAVDRCMKRMERTVEGFNGRIVKMVGDELMAAFPLADEALQAAVEMQQRIADLPPVSGVKLEIRIGFAHGEVVEEDGTFSGETVNLAASLAGIANPGQILTSRESLAALSSTLLRFTRDLASAPTGGRLPTAAITEVFTHDPHEPALTTTAAPAKETAAQSGSKLRIQYKGKVVVFDQRQPAITLGRDQDCDLVIHDRRASRQHAAIEWRNGHPFLIDRSTNGTFVALGSNPEVFLRRSECALQGKGTICFAGSATSPETNAARDCAHFELFD
ncbi:MAG: adenylate/guanylate cyclase domain-containing protein [Propionivibrio sp.]